MTAAGPGRPEPPRVYLVGPDGSREPARTALPRHDDAVGSLGSDAVGSDRPRRRWPALVGAGLLVLGLGSVRADAALADRELDALLTRAEAGLGTISYVDRRIQGTVGYFSPALVSPSVDQRVRDSLQGIVREEAAGQVVALQRHRSAAADVRVLPWHGAEREAQRRWLACLDERIAYLEQVSVEFRRLFEPRPEQEAALEQAREAFARAGAAEARTAAFDR